MNITKEYNIEIDVSGEYIYVSDNLWIHEDELDNDTIDNAEYGVSGHEILCDLLYKIEGVSYVDADCSVIVSLKDMPIEAEQKVYEQIKNLCQYIEDGRIIKTCSSPETGPARFLLPEFFTE